MEPTTRRRILVVGLVTVGGAAAFLLVPQLRDAIPATPAAWLRVSAWFGGLALFGLLVWRLVRPRWLGAMLGLVPLVGFAVWALAPAFYDRTVNEAFPVVVVADAAVPPTTAVVAPTSVTAATTPRTTSTVLATGAAAAEATTTTAPTATASAPAAEVVVLGSGSLRGLAGHDASGRAALYRLADGSHVVRFEDLDVERAPDLHVYLVPGAQQTSPNGGVRLAKLKGNKGNQNYTVPADVDIEAFDGVLIWCKKFSVQVAGAPLT